jgi:L-alanine-DL-glutamate epimerase-like enolase superfamily enzyme
MHLFPGYVDYFRPLLVGRNPMDTRSIAIDLGEKLIKILGPAGINTQVLAAINIACWDIKGKALGQSVHQLLGGAQKRIRTYIAGGYYAEGKGLEELQEEVRFNVAEMHASAVKIKIGDPKVSVAGDLRRVEAARKAIGDQVTLMVDANCALDLKTALEFARFLLDYNVYWFEEPLPIHDYEGHGKLAQAATVKIATGENGYHLAHFRTLLEHRGASILNVDVTICPGYDVAKEIADLAAEHGVSIAPHGCQELQLPLAAGVPHGEFLKYYPVAVDPLRAEMFQPALRPDDDGFVTVPDRPGIGFELNMQLLDRYRVA